MSALSSFQGASLRKERASSPVLSRDPIMLGIRGDANRGDEMEGMNAMTDD